MVLQLIYYLEGMGFCLKNIPRWFLYIDGVAEMKYINFCEGGRALRIAFGTILLAILLMAGSAGAVTWTVDDSGGANYTKIQDAIDNASAGDTILVYSGTYYENVDLNKQLTLRGVDNSGGGPIVNAGGSGSAITLSAGNSILEGVTTINASWPNVGIYVKSNNNMLRNNTASNNNYNGIELRDSINNTLKDNNASSNHQYGIYLVYSNNNKLNGNNAFENMKGIYLYSSNNNQLDNNNASNNSGGIRLDYSANNILRSNKIWNINYGIVLSASNNNLIYNNYFINKNNAYDEGNNIWNITITLGTNIIGGSWLGGNFWSDYAGKDIDGDGLGDTMLPYNSSGGITNGGDFLPLTTAPTPTAGSISGFKINDTNGNGKWDAGEKVISNWTIRMIGITGTGKDAKVIRKETFTDALGFYKFDNLPAGRYIVIEKLKRGFVPTSSPIKRIKLAQDENSMNNNFTNRPVHNSARINDQRDVDYYEIINRDIDKYKEETD